MCFIFSARYSNTYLKSEIYVIYKNKGSIYSFLTEYIETKIICDEFYYAVNRIKIAVNKEKLILFTSSLIFVNFFVDILRFIS